MAKEFDKDEENVLKNDNMWKMGVFLEGGVSLKEIN
jgi:hypothetical protein